MFSEVTGWILLGLYIVEFLTLMVTTTILTKYIIQRLQIGVISVAMFTIWWILMSYWVQLGGSILIRSFMMFHIDFIGYQELTTFVWIGSHAFILIGIITFTIIVYKENFDSYIVTNNAERGERDDKH